MSGIFLFAVWCIGYMLLKYLHPVKGVYSLLLGWYIGSIVVMAVMFGVLQSSRITLDQLIAIVILTAIVILIFHAQSLFRWVTGDMSAKSFGIIIALGAIFYALFDQSFSYDITQGRIGVASNVYIDFGAHLPITRSFSIGDPQPFFLPFYDKAIVPYHVLSDMYAGILERLGMRVDVGLNVLSSLAMCTVVVILVRMGSVIFRSRIAGIWAAVFLFFSFDLSSLAFIQTHFPKGLSEFAAAVWRHDAYLLAGPLGERTIEVFWSVNTYLNQRQLLFGLTGVLLLSMYLYSRESRRLSAAVLTGGIIGCLPLWNMPAFISSMMILIFSLFFVRDRRHTLVLFLVSIAISVPSVWYIHSYSSNTLLWRPGFMIAPEGISFGETIMYWFWNTGILIPLTLCGVLLSRQWKFWICVVPLFIAPNLIQFTQDMFDNHKFFVIWAVVMGLFVGYVYDIIWKSGAAGRLAVVLLLPFVLFSGVLHLMVVKNDHLVYHVDSKYTPIRQWIEEGMFHDDSPSILTTSELYDPIQLAGGRTYLGRTHYLFLYGEDRARLDSRLTTRQTLLNTTDSALVVSTAKQEGIGYIGIYENENLTVASDAAVLTFQIVFRDDHLTIYDVAR